MTKEKSIHRTLDDLFQEFKKKRVAVYARVSREGILKHQSIEAQTEHLKAYIEKHPGWEFVGCYVDEGVTGTKLDRPEFNRMLEDARAGKLDIILTKSVSRMGRNSSALFRVIQELKEVGVTVVFDSERITTDNPQAMFQLQYNGIMAEKVSATISKYQKTAIRARYKEGIPYSGRPYGYIMVDHQYQIIPEEAEVVKRIFKMYLSGMGKQAISKKLNQEAIRTQTGAKWQSSTIRYVLRNEVYVGDLLLQKSFIRDHITKKKLKNYGEEDQYYVKNAHEPTIDRKTFEKAQQEIARRDKLYGGHNIMQDKAPRLFSQLVHCDHCKGTIYYKLQYGSKSRKTWVCKAHMELGPDHCPVKPIREDILINATREVLLSENLIQQDTILTNELLKTHIRQIIAKDNYDLEYQLYNGGIYIKSCKCPSRSESWTPEMKQKARERSLAMHAKRKEANHG